MKDIGYIQILDFPFQASLVNARLEAVRQENRSDGGIELVVDYQELQLAQEPQLIEQDNKPAEFLQGHYHPRRLRFFNVSSLRQEGAMAELSTLPPEHGVRSIKGILHWEFEGMRHYVFFHNSAEPAHLYFAADGCGAEERNGVVSAVELTRNWAITPPLIPCCFPPVESRHFPYGGDPIPIHRDGKTYYDRLIVGGLSSQGDVRPEVDAVLNLGEEPSKWVVGESAHPADRWAERGEGQAGMDLAQMQAEAAWVIERLQKEQRVLVHCVAGFNRSVTICCIVMMMLEGISAETALTRIREYHPWARPDSHHWLQLRWLAERPISESESVVK